MTNPQYELPGRQERDAIHTGRIVPIYEKAGCATCRVQRALVHDVVQQLPADLGRGAAGLAARRGAGCPTGGRPLPRRISRPPARRSTR